MKIDPQKIIDISIDLSPRTIVYPDDPQPNVYWKFEIAKGYPSNVGFMDVGLHHGTHVDSPFHFFSNGDAVEVMSLDHWVGPCAVIDFTHLSKCIEPSDVDLAFPPDDCDRLLLKTRNSLVYLKQTGFNRDFIYITRDVAQCFVDRGVKTVGLDYITVDPYGSKLDAHKVLLSNGVAIIEGINLERVESGHYMLFCMPLRIAGMEAAPARAFLYPK